MTTVKIQGGLGNQLFQYAFGRALMEKAFEVVFDTSFFSTNTKYTKRNFGLEAFALKSGIVIKNAPKKNSILKKILHRIDSDKKIRYVQSFLTHPSVCMDGYYNSEKYFTFIRQELLREIILKHKSNAYLQLEKLIQDTPNSLIIHARRGDYLKSTGFTILDKEYYLKALTYFPKDVQIFAFSDDIEWLESVLDRDVYSVSGRGLEDFEELSLMAQGKNFIIANSTFSWWGAWLAQYENKKVIAPKKWFRSLLWWRANKDVVPSEWIRI